MAIRHWHPAKIAMFWVLDIALLVAIWEPCHTYFEMSFTQCFYRRNILIWLVLSLPLFILTWKWASSRESRQGAQPASALTDTASIRRAVLDSAINGRVLILKTKYESEFHGRVVREGPSSFEFYSIGSKKLTSFTLDEIASVRIINEELTLPPGWSEYRIEQGL